MFETLSRARPRRPAAGTAVSIVLHVAVIGAVLWFTRVHKPAQVVIEDLPILRPKPIGDSRPTGPGGPKPIHRKTSHTPSKKLVQPVEPPAPEVVEPAIIEDEPQPE